MLQSIRNVVTGWVAVIIVVLLIIPFAFWGIDSYFNVSSVNAASVNGVDVSLAEYQRTFQNVRQQWQNISPSMAEQPEFIKQQTLDSLVDRLLLAELTTELGLRVNDTQVRLAINDIPAFRTPEGFNSVAYQSYLQSQGYTPVRFENEIRQDMTLQQIQAGLIQTIIVPKAEALKLAALQGQSRDFRYAVISHDNLLQGVEVSDAEIQDYYQKNEQQFMRAEEVKVAYIQLSSADLAQSITVDEESLLAYFDAAKQNYSLAERRKVRQVLVYAEGDNKQQAEAVSKEIHTQLTSGTTFDAVKDSYASNTEVTVEVSDFGFINKGVLDTAVDEQVFALEKGAISEPILTEYGYQILTVDDITGGTSAEFEDVRAEVELDYRKEQAQKRFFEMYDELAVLTFEHPDTLDMASETLGLPIMQSGVITRDNASEPVLNDPRVLTAIFSDEVLTTRINSDLIEIAQDQVVVVRVVDHQVAEKKPLEEVRTEVIDQLKAEKASARAQTQGDEIRQKLSQGGAADALATEYNIQWINQIGIRRDNTNLDRDILQAVFKTGKPAGSPVIDGVALANGDYAVLLVDVVNEVATDSLADTVIEPVKGYLQQAMASRSLTLIVEDLRKRADIQIFDTNL
jgi:peptidyl-prolyl cis-trans isomerase D